MEVLSIKALFFTGLNDSIKSALTEISPIIKPIIVPITKNLNSH